MSISIWTDLLRLSAWPGARSAPTSADTPATGADDTHARRPRTRERPRVLATARALGDAPAQRRAAEHPVERVVDRVARVPDAGASGAAHERQSDEIARWQGRVLDLLSDGVVLVDVEGQVVYRNSAAAALLHGDGAPLLREVRALALSALARSAPPRTAMVDAACELTTDAVQYRLSAVRAPASLLAPGLVSVGDGPLVLVTVTRSSAALPSPLALRRRFQLTAREASVALLLAEGRSNGSIARRLGISASTARHYTETVLLKLAVPSRAAVAAVLLGIYEHTDEHPLPGAHALSAPVRR